MGRCKKGRQKETRNANRTGGTSTRSDGRVDAYLTIDTPAGPHRLRTTKATQELADAWEMIPKNPAAHLRAPHYRPKETAYVRAEDVGRYLVAALGGPRPAELFALRWDDFDEASGTLRIDESVSHLGNGELDWNEPKSEMGLRVLPLAGEARMLLAERRRGALEAWMASGTRGGGKEGFRRSLIFPRPDDLGRPYGRHALQDRAGLKRVHLYALRHTASMLLGRSGPDVKTTQGLMGRADARTTLKIYTHFEEEREGGGQPSGRLPGRHFGAK